MDKEIRPPSSKELGELLTRSFEKLRIAYEDENALKDHFALYMNSLLSYNSHTNLTAITEPEEIYQKHFVDSASTIVALEHILKKYRAPYASASFIDVGTGAGFPAVPVKILRPTIRLTLLDSLEKRIRFLRELSSALEFSNIEILHARAEDAAQNKALRASFDFVLSRAVAGLPVLLEYCIPFLKKGGFMICLKGPSIEEEMLSAKKAMQLLGTELCDILDVQIPFTDWSHKIAVFRKVKDTDARYPRKAGKPSKEPLK